MQAPVGHLCHLWGTCVSSPSAAWGRATTLAPRWLTESFTQSPGDAELRDVPRLGRSTSDRPAEGLGHGHPDSES